MRRVESPSLHKILAAGGPLVLPDLYGFERFRFWSAFFAHHWPGRSMAFSEGFTTDRGQRRLFGSQGGASHRVRGVGDAAMAGISQTSKGRKSPVVVARCSQCVAGRGPIRDHRRNSSVFRAGEDSIGLGCVN